MTFRFFLKWAFQNIRNHSVRYLLTAVGVAVAAAILVFILGFYRGYRDSLRESIEKMGFHVLVTAKGCPYEAATLILRGGQIPMYIDEQIYREVASHPSVDFVSKLFLQTVPAEGGRVHFFMGVEESLLQMKPWMVFQRGDWFSGEDPDEVILGFNAASFLEKDAGDRIYFPELDRSFEVAGIFGRTGSQDDGTIFLPLKAAQKIFDKKDKLTGLGIRVRELEELDRFVEEIYDIPSVQVIATAQIQGTLLRLVDSIRGIMLTIAVCSSLIAALALANIVLMSVFERTREFGVLRAVGGSDRHLFSIVCLETAMVSFGGALLGILMVFLLRGLAEAIVRMILPFSPAGVILQVDWRDQLLVVALAVLAGIFCSLYPAFRATRVRPVRSMAYGE